MCLVSDPQKIPTRSLYPDTLNAEMLLFCSSTHFWFLPQALGVHIQVFVSRVPSPFQAAGRIQDHPTESLGTSIYCMRNSHVYLYATNSGSSAQLIPAKQHSKGSKFKVILQTVSSLPKILQQEQDLQQSMTSIYMSLLLSILSRLTEVPPCLRGSYYLTQWNGKGTYSSTFLKEILLTKTYFIHLFYLFNNLKMGGGWEECVLGCWSDGISLRPYPQTHYNLHIPLHVKAIVPS